MTSRSSRRAGQLLLLLLLAAAAAVVMDAGAELEGECGADGPRLLVRSSRNATGHWTVALTLQRESAGHRPGHPDTLLVEVQPTTARCRGTRDHTLHVAMHGPPQAEPGYEQVEGFGFYKLHTKKTTWEKAKVVCEEEGAYLVILNSEAEADAILRLIKRMGVKDHNVFAGFHDKDEEGKHITVLGDAVDSTGFVRWNPGQPDDTQPGEDCGAINKDTGSLNDVPCSVFVATFICEQIVI